ncbi:MAG: 23S rRNA (pseudouridine(1915)-N(3))-methyltransferase RlmH [Oscillospiraceae bacterium]|nr:23S rRNA (pseudouridine(1915)-N(3))-methyltransferase RlmH [Oscillospiraceae bacterium]
MQNITIIAMGKVQKGFMLDGCNEYIKRLKTMCNLKIVQLEDVQLMEKNLSDAMIQKTLDREADEIIKNIPKHSYVIAMCIEGKQMSSEELAKMFSDKAVEGFSNICFIIGSSHGLSDRVKQLSNYKMSMSKMTFPHQLARVMLLEQIYRGFSILGGSKYHK